MKTLHIHLSVDSLEQSVKFYSTLFGQEPTKLKPDYAKWNLSEPSVVFAISDRSDQKGLDHLGIHVDSESELQEITSRLKTAETELFDEGEATCCYAKSVKAWSKDPSGIAWETYHNMEDIDIFSEPKAEKTPDSCCAPKQNTPKKSCC